jgi:nickel superoxide dismutase
VLKDLQTHQATIEKAMAQIIELSKDPAKNANQIARWVVNKEEHASKIQDTMTRYFLAQRIKLDEAASNKAAYLKKITLVHQIIVYAMKCKQGTDVKNAEMLNQAIDSFTQAYSAK